MLQITNLASSLFSWSYDTSIFTVTYKCDISSGDTTNTNSISLTFTLSKAVNSFVDSDITVVNGLITGLKIMMQYIKVITT